MNDIQQQMIQLLEKMDEVQQSELLRYAHEILEDRKITLQDLLEFSKQSQDDLRKQHGDRLMTSSAELINQLREERDEEIIDALKGRR
jgi:ABC-type transporter Mla subunit MlaD